MIVSRRRPKSDSVFFIPFLLQITADVLIRYLKIQIESVVSLLFRRQSNVDHSSKLFNTLPSCNMAQRKQQADYHSIRHDAGFIWLTVADPFHRKTRLSTAVVVPRTFEKRAVGEQISRDKTAPFQFGRKAKQLS